MNKTAIVICNYNMPERTDALVDHIHKVVHRPYDLFVVERIIEVPLATLDILERI